MLVAGKDATKYFGWTFRLLFCVIALSLSLRVSLVSNVLFIFLKDDSICDCHIDATHPWVNYEVLLSPCCIGILVPSDQIYTKFANKRIKNHNNNNDVSNKNVNENFANVTQFPAPDSQQQVRK
jgi:hypothetical protein